MTAPESKKDSVEDARGTLGTFGGVFTPSILTILGIGLLSIAYGARRDAIAMKADTAAMLAAFMSTFAGTLNATQAYIVNDIYLKYIEPAAPNSRIKFINYGAGLIMVFISIILGFYAKDVNDILQWIVSGLYGGGVAVGASTSKMSKKKFSEFVEFIYSEGTERGVMWSEPSLDTYASYREAQ